MPLVRIDLVKGRNPEEVIKLGRAIHAALIEVMEIPERDKFQIITEHEVHEITAEDAGLGFERDNSVLMIQIITQRGRSQNTKQLVYQKITANLASVGITPNNVFISYVENSAADWSFGFGEAQFLTGKLKAYSE